MALVLADRVKETASAPGTGNVTLLGASLGFQTFAAIGNGNTTYYTISDQGGPNWEVGIGTYSSTGPTLTRDVVLESSNGGSLTDFNAGTQDVFVTYPAEKATYLNASNNVSALGVITSGVWNGTDITTPYGGTGLTSYTAGDITYYTSGTSLSKLGIGANGYVLTSNGSAPQWTAATSIVGGAAGSNTQVQFNNSGALGASANLTFNGTTLTSTGFSGPLNGTIGASTPAAGTFTSLSDSGNLTFTGTGNRITGDFSNATVANRVAFQTSTTNGATALGIIPNGTSNYAEMSVNTDSSYTNSSTLSAIVDGSTASLKAAIRGTGSYLPMTFFTGGSERMRITTNGGVSFGSSGTAYGTSGQVLQSNGDAAPTWVTPSSGGYAISVIGTNTTAVKGTLYVLTASLTLTLPASPTAGDQVAISNLSGTTTAVIARNGQKIMNLSEDMTVDVISAGITLVYSGATYGWVTI